MITIQSIEILFIRACPPTFGGRVAMSLLAFCASTKELKQALQRSGKLVGKAILGRERIFQHFTKTLRAYKMK